MQLEERGNSNVNENCRISGEKGFDEIHSAVIGTNLPSEKSSDFNANVCRNIEINEIIKVSTARRTTNIETMMHLFKGNVGPGCFAMADAIKNGGLILGPVLTLFLGVFCVHAQHILLQCSAKMKQKYSLESNPDYAETVELCFASSTNEKFRKRATTMKTICNTFICITQLGFCCIYFLFVGSNLEQVLNFYDIRVGIHGLMAISLVPIWLTALITNLKFLGKKV